MTIQKVDFVKCFEKWKRTLDYVRLQERYFQENYIVIARCGLVRFVFVNINIRWISTFRIDTSPVMLN